MMRAQSRGESNSATSTVRVLPVRTSFWKWVEGKGVKCDSRKNPSSVKLEEERRQGRTVWIETRLEGLEKEDEKEELEWFDGSLEAWDSIAPIPKVSWGEMDRILTAVGLESPKQTPAGNEPPATRLLRAIPYLYVQGTFATIRDVRLGSGLIDKLKVRLSNGQLAAFPVVGFDPSPGYANYTMVRTMVGLVKGVVITVRLPDVAFSGPDEGGTVRENGGAPLAVRERFFPLLKVPDGRDVAEAIGIHQATTARAVVERIRNRLNEHEALARKLNERDEGSRQSGRPDRRKGEADRRRKARTARPDALPDRRRGSDDRRRTDAQLREDVVKAREDTGRLSEITHRLDQQIARIMRRFGGSPVDARRPENEDKGLVPEEIRLRYQFALDDVRQLRDDCKLASESINEALTTFDRNQREQLQFIAALLASVVLIPTLIASVFGVNLGVPGEGSVVGFIAFVAAIAALGLIGYSALQTSREYHWSPPKSELTFHAAGAAGIVILLIVVLALVS